MVPAHLEESPLIFLAFIVPLAFYCLALSVLNRRRHPVFVPGPWDFAGVLFAASGFLLFGGPAILTGIYEQWRLSWLLGQTQYLQGIGENWSFWISLWLLYFAVVAGASAVVLRRRRRQTSIYNVETTVLAEALPLVFDRLGLEAHPSGPRRLLLRFRETTLEGPGSELGPVRIPRGAQAEGAVVLAEHRHPQRIPVTGRGTAISAHPWAELSVESFPTMRHVTLHWQGQDEAIRLEVEIELSKMLARVPSHHNPAARWFLSLSIGLFLGAFLVFLMLVAIRVLQLPR